MVDKKLIKGMQSIGRSIITQNAKHRDLILSCIEGILEADEGNEDE